MPLPPPKALGLAVGAFAPSTEAALAIGPAVMLVWIVFGGYYANAGARGRAHMGMAHAARGINVSLPCLLLSWPVSAVLLILVTSIPATLCGRHRHVNPAKHKAVKL